METMQDHVRKAVLNRLESFSHENLLKVTDGLLMMLPARCLFAVQAVLSRPFEDTKEPIQAKHFVLKLSGGEAE